MFIGSPPPREMSEIWSEIIAGNRENSDTPMSRSPQTGFSSSSAARLDAHRGRYPGLFSPIPFQSHHRAVGAKQPALRVCPYEHGVEVVAAFEFEHLDRIAVPGPVRRNFAALALVVVGLGFTEGND